MHTRSSQFGILAGFFLALAALTGPCAQAQGTATVTIHVAAAADLEPVMPAIAAAFEKETGIHAAISYGSSSSLAAQIIHGAPMDIFFSADYSFAERVVAANLADTPEPALYAKGTLVLWQRKDGPFHPLTIDALSSPELKSVAVANPLTAPYGLAAKLAMEHMHLWDKVAPHQVQADNVAQAAQFADTGNAQLAFISLTLASSAHMAQTGMYVLVPDSQYPEIRQCATVMRSAPQRAAAHKFLDYVLSGAVQAQLEHFGLRSKDK